MSEWVVVHDQPHYVSRYEEILALEGVDLIDPTKVMLAQELERLEKRAMLQEESNQKRKEAIQRQEEANQLIKKRLRLRRQICG
ncbi:BnaC05g30470D [Brassica napus]|uniref:BnaC05g30470D protein n=1 Tax=Brassica napus TaxID=3708 RepID=A0A078HKJ0_BRANA|nr:BnaC05g30470D [Brassica napus]